MGHDNRGKVGKKALDSGHISKVASAVDRLNVIYERTMNLEWLPGACPE